MGMGVGQGIADYPEQASVYHGRNVVDKQWLDDNVKKEQIKLTYKQVPTLTITNILTAAILAFLVWDEVPDKNLIYTWLIMNYTVTVVITGILLFFYHKTPEQEKNYSTWGKLVVALGFIRATSWGSMCVLLYIPGSIVSLMLISLFIIGGSGLIMFLASAYKPAFYTISLPILLPLIVNVALVGDVFHVASAIAFLAYSIALVVYYQNIHATVVDALRLRFTQGKLLDELEVQKQQAEEANLAKSKFLAAASHDLRQPLHAQGMFLAELQARNKDTSLTPIIANLSSSVEAMRGLFTALLDMSKLDANIVNPKTETFALNNIFEDIELHFKEIASSKNLKLIVRYTDLYVTTDLNLLKRILWNLVSNAVHYTNRGKILLSARKRGKKVRIEVWDTGIGIPEREISNIFREFYQLHNSERDRSKGLGLGLAIAARLANLLETKIRVNTVVYRGSVFSLDVGRAAPPDDKNIPKPVQNFRLIEGTRKHKILVIDDDAANLAAMEGILKQWGHDVIPAISLKDALSRIKFLTPSIIIADFRLQGDDTGLQAIREINEKIGKSIPAMIVTGDMAPDRLSEVSASGYRLLHKPVAPAKLRSMLAYLDTLSDARSDKDEKASTSDVVNYFAE